MKTTRLSSKGQVILPKSVRLAHDWQPGTELAVEDREDGVLLKPLKPFKPTRIENVIGCVGYVGPARTLEEIEEAIAIGARKQK